MNNTNTEHPVSLREHMAPIVWINPNKPFGRDELLIWHDKNIGHSIYHLRRVYDIISGKWEDPTEVEELMILGSRGKECLYRKSGTNYHSTLNAVSMCDYGYWVDKNVGRYQYHSEFWYSRSVAEKRLKVFTHPKLDRRIRGDQKSVEFFLERVLKA